MSLTQPLLLTQTAFDATNAQTFLFNVVGGSQVVKNTLKITDNTTNIVVYEQTQTTYTFEHILPANTLTNSKNYVAQIQTIDANNDTSPWSNIITFYCYATPTFTISNMPTGNIIANSSYVFQATYNQASGELLNSYDFILYDSSNNQISTSGVQYVGSSTPPPTIISHKFSGFEDNTIYKIEVKGVTANGTIITTGIIQFITNYTVPISFGAFELANNCNDGYINIISNMLSIKAQSNPSPPIYIEGEEVDLVNTGTYVEWIEGFDIPNDFVLRVWGRAFMLNNVICIASNPDMPNEKLLLTYHYDNVNKEVSIIVEYITGGQSSFFFSNAITVPIAKDQLFVWVKKIGDNITVNLDVTYVSPDRTYIWYDVNNRNYTFQDVNNLNITWAQANQGGW